MIINIGDIKKVGVVHAIRVAMGEISNSLATAFNCTVPEKKQYGLV